MKGRRLARWLVVGGVALAFAAGAQAQVKKKEDVDWALTGKIVSVDLAGKLLNLQEAGDGPVQSVAVDDKTTIMKGDAKIGLSDLKKGWHVAVDGDDREGRKVATYIEVVDE